MPDPESQGLRASDADREATVERLHVAAVEGRLDAIELDERLTAAYAARYCSELTRLTADVTPTVPAPSAAPTFIRPTASTNPLAIAALVCAVIWFGWIGSVLAIVFGHVSLNQIRASGGRQRGKGFAIAGLAIGYFALLTLALVLIANAF